MEFIKQIERFQVLNKLVKDECTGRPEELARRLGVSRAKLYLMLEELRDYGVEVVFSKKINSFKYKNCSGLNLNFSLKVLDENEARMVLGGENLTFSLESKILDGALLHLKHDYSRII
ncbi:TrmB family transcriptional regulator [Cyclobacterium plantarum]|uniref:TrmB family transcriptional regulator n=1 Tax=Cyclobacterium plantarum TaxID=2716263 RepID=A0ABX0H9U6_9BACT|nr:TrmB family transcriptional regulator [Cyclobacterium plantarum]NHE58626.1 TrmB family transcriptional regulator [Cyclobacterium plantarum]